MKVLRLLLVQALVMLAVSLPIQFLRPLPALYHAGIWVVIPLAGACTAAGIVRKGLNAYLSWLIPPLMAAVAGVIASMGYRPNAGSVFVCALVSICGAAYGDTYVRFRKKRRRK